MVEDSITRREFVCSAAARLAGVALTPAIIAGCRRGSPLVASAARVESGGTGWASVPETLARIAPPKFADREFNITRFGARPDGSDCTSPIREAVAACTNARGGRVTVPAGRFVTGPVHLADNVNLHLERGATLAFTRDTNAYLPAVFTRFEGTELMNYSPLVYAFEKQNVAVTGEGTLDGQADHEHWWPWKGSREFGWTTGSPNYNAARQRLLAMAEEGVPVGRRLFGEGDHLRPSFIQPYRCSNVLIEGVTIVNSPMWEIHPVRCRNVIVRGVSISSLGPNNDGCNPESCRDVLIERTTFNTGDDCIAVKSGRNADGRRLNVPSENIIVRNCEMKDGHGGVTIGSEISGGARNIFAHDCRMDSPRLDRALRLKNNAMRGGLIEHIYMRNVTIGQVADSVLSIDFYYEEGDTGSFTPVARDIELRNVTSRTSPYALYLRGFPNAHIGDIRVIDCRFNGVEKGSVTEYVDGLRWEGTTINGAVVR